MPSDKSEIINQKSEIPFDRGHLATEQRNAASAELDGMSVAQMLRLMNDEDSRPAAAVGAALPAIGRVVERVVASFERGGRLIYFGAGTSGRLGVLDASECPPTFCTDPSMVVGVIAGGDGALRRSSEGAEDNPDGAAAEVDRLKVDARDTVVGIAAGGTTPYVWGALRLAKSRGAATAMVMCVPASSLADRVDLALADELVEIVTGPEVVTGSTRMKAGTATKMTLNMITTAAMVRVGKVWGNLMVDVRASNAKLIDRAARIIAGETGLPRDRAIALLHDAGGSVKTALVMRKRGVGRAEAERLLAEAGGRMRAVLATGHEAR